VTFSYLTGSDLNDIQHQWVVAMFSKSTDADFIALFNRWQRTFKAFG